MQACLLQPAISTQRPPLAVVVLEFLLLPITLYTRVNCFSGEQKKNGYGYEQYKLRRGGGKLDLERESS